MFFNQLKHEPRTSVPKVRNLMFHSQLKHEPRMSVPKVRNLMFHSQLKHEPRMSVPKVRGVVHGFGLRKLSYKMTYDDDDGWECSQGFQEK